jgi:hypothetical protein
LTRTTLTRAALTSRAAAARHPAAARHAAHARAALARAAVNLARKSRTGIRAEVAVANVVARAADPDGHRQCQGSESEKPSPQAHPLKIMHVATKTKPRAVI